MPRHLAIGDIHGCYRSLCELCDVVKLRPDDVIITLGDYCNRGPNTNAVLDWLIHLDNAFNLQPLRGNHDIMMLRAQEGESELRKWLDVGGDATLASYAMFEGTAGTLADVPERHWQFLSGRLLPYFETATHFFVHAGAYPELPLAEQPDYMLYWEQFHDPPKHESGKTMICGHTSQRYGLPLSIGHAVCIDTSACRGGWLTCLHAESGQLWQANERGESREMWLDELD